MLVHAYDPHIPLAVMTTEGIRDMRQHLALGRQSRALPGPDRAPVRVRRVGMHHLPVHDTLVLLRATASTA